jgi:hypothetical protein
VHRSCTKVAPFILEVALTVEVEACEEQADTNIIIVVIIISRYILLDFIIDARLSF